MNKILFSIFFLFIFISSTAFAQQERRPTYAPFSERHRNKLDELGQKQGTWKFYNRTGDLMYEFDFVNDKKHGPSKRYFVGEKVMDEVDYIDGKKDGNYRKYYYSGQVKEEGQYENGKRSGKWLYYYDDGTVKIEGSYKLGQMDGEWATKDKKGNIRSQRTYSNGVDTEIIKKQNELKAAKNALKEGSKANTKSPAAAPAKPVK